MAENLQRTSEEFADCYNRHVNMVYQICYLHLKNHADSEDATQAVFLKLYHSNKEFTDNEHVKAWLIVTAKNHCRNILKHWWRAQRIDYETLPETPYFDRTERLDLTEQLLALPEKYKTVLYLYYYMGYSIREMAGILSIKESTIQTQLAKGRELLRREIDEERGI